jgi:nitrogen regulatory protein PII
VKKVEAYVRVNMVQHVVAALAAEGTREFSLVEVQRIMPGLPRDAYDFSVNLGGAFEPMVRFDIVCRDENADRLVAAVRKAASTGRAGDGKIFVLPVLEAVRIRNDERGDAALAL